MTSRPSRSETSFRHTLSDAGFKFIPMYGEMGSVIYEAMTSTDTSEPRSILSLLKGKQKVLELACGDGRITLPLLARGHSVTAVDNSSKMLDLLEAKSRRHPALSRRLTPILADICDSNLPSVGTHDASLIGASTITLFNRSSRIKILTTMRSRTRTNGPVIVTQFTPSNTSRRESIIPLPQIDSEIRLVDDPSICGSYRDIYVIPTKYRGEPVSQTVLHHRVNILSKEDLRSDLRDAGIETSDVIDVGGEDGPFGSASVLLGRGASV